MGTAAPQPTLSHLRQTLAGIDPSNRPPPRRRGAAHWACRPDRRRRSAAGLPAARCMSLPPRRRCISAPPADLPSRSRRAPAATRRQVLWVATDYAAGEGGGPYGPGLDLFGMASARLLVLRVPKPGRCALGDGGGAALPRARLRHRRTDRRGRGGRSHRDAPPRARRARRRQRAELRPRPADPPPHHAMPSAAATRWEIAPALSQPDAYGGTRPRAFRPFSPQEPARTVRPLDHRVGPS